VRTKVYEDYIRDNVANWFEWSRNDGLPVERLEDLILVTGCTLVTSWAVATFIDDTQEISLAVQALPNGRGKFDWSRMRGNVPHHNSQHDPVRPSRWLLCLPCTDYYFRSKWKAHPRHRTSASSSGASEQNAVGCCLGASELQRNPFRTTLTTVVRMTSK
jgi:hypothetical protein